jgi:hypothetical protein
MKEAEVIYDNINRIIYKGLVEVVDIVISANGADGEVNIYDGQNDKGILKYKLSIKDGNSFGGFPTKPIFFHRGIFITVNAATTYYSIRIDPVNV